MPLCDLKGQVKNLFRKGMSDEEFKQNKSLTHIGTGSIGIVPNEVLLDIFDFYREGLVDPRDGNWSWCTLVHVCRRWRHIILTSPRRLDLRLLCTIGTPVRKYLDCWPPTFPIAIKYRFYEFFDPHPEDVRNIFIALEKPDRVCSIELCATSSLLAKVSMVMQVPFPALKNLFLSPMDSGTPIVSQNFLGGLAPGLRKFSSVDKLTSHSALPKFLLSCNDLVDLKLMGMSNPNHVPPEVIVTILSGLSRLKAFYIAFSSLRPSISSYPPLHPRSTLSTLSDVLFYGSSEYLEDLIARIDTPSLQRIDIHLWHRPTDAPQLRQLIYRTEGLRSPNQARIIKNDRTINLTFRSTGSPIVRYHPVTSQFKNFNIAVSTHDWQFSSAVQFCLQSVPLTSSVKRLIVESTVEQALWKEVIGPADWLDLFRPFSAVEELYVSPLLGSPVAFALAGATGEAEILPALRSVFFEEGKESASLKETIKPFSVARRLSHCDVSASSVERF